MPDEIWADYLDKMKRLEEAVRLTVFWTRETVKAVEEVVKYTEGTTRNIRAYLTKLKDQEIE